MLSPDDHPSDAKSELLHWAVVNIPACDVEKGFSSFPFPSPFLGLPFYHSYPFAFWLIGTPFWLQSSFTLGTVVASYVPPVPLKGTGFSREVVVLLEQSAGLDTERLNIDNTLEGTPSKNIGLRIQLNFKLF